MKKLFSNSWAARHPLVLIILLAAVLRLVVLPHVFYGYTDEWARDLSSVREIADGKLAVLGPPALGGAATEGKLFYSALFYYLILPVAVFFRFSPQWSVLSGTIVSLLSIWMLYKLIRLWFGRADLALLAAFLLAVSMYDIQNASYLHNPNFLPFFMLVFLYNLSQILLRQQRWYDPWLAGLSLGVASQLHFSAVPVLGLVFLLVMVFQKFSGKALAVFKIGFIALLTWLPYLVYDSMHGFSNMHKLFAIGQGGFSLIPNFLSSVYLLDFFNSLLLVKITAFDFFKVAPTAHWMLVGLEAAMIVVLYFYFRGKNLRAGFENISAVGRRMILFLAIAAVITFVFNTSLVYHYYFLVLWPLPVILFVWFFSAVKKISLRLSWVLIAVYVLFQVTQLMYFYAYAT